MGLRALDADGLDPVGLVNRIAGKTGGRYGGGVLARRPVGVAVTYISELDNRLGGARKHLGKRRGPGRRSFGTELSKPGWPGRRPLGGRCGGVCWLRRNTRGNMLLDEVEEFLRRLGHRRAGKL